MKYKYFNKLMIAIMSLGSIFLCLYRVIALNRYKRITTDSSWGIFLFGRT